MPTGINCGGTCSASYDSGTVVTLTATPDASSNFTGWSVSLRRCRFVYGHDGYGPQRDGNIYAQTFTLTYTAGANGSLTGSTSQMVNYGDDGTAVTANADSGFHFVDWSPGGSTANPRTDTNVMANASYTANFAADANIAPILNSAVVVTLVSQVQNDPLPVGMVGSPVSGMADLVSIAGGLDNVVDPDIGAVTGVALVGSDTASGTWYFSIDDGMNWVALGAVSDSTARLLPAVGGRVYFKPNLGFAGNVTSGLTFRAWDQTSGLPGLVADTSMNGGATAFSTATDTASITVSPLPCTPVGTVYVDDDWAGTPIGTDPDMGGPATQFGCDSFATIQGGVAGVTSGGTVNVAAGTYIESGQIVISKDVTVIGADRATTIIKPDFDTGNSGDARGWFLVNDGFTFNLSKVTLDGTGHLVYQGIRDKGQGTIDDCAFTNIAYPGYSGVGIAAFGGTAMAPMNVDVTNCVFSGIGREGVLFFGAGITNSSYTGNTYTGKGTGDWLDYAVEVGGGAKASLSGNTISNNTGVAISDGSTSGAVLVTTYFGSGSEAVITGNTFTGNLYGLLIGYDGSDTSTVTAHFNRFTGNGTGASSTAPAIDAENNWWGCNAGPGNAGCDTVTGPVDADPWIVLGVSATPNSILQGANSNVTADMTQNSDMATPAGTLPDIPVAFSATEGTMAPPSGTVTAGTASSVFTSTTVNNGMACADVDNQQVCAPIMVTPSMTPSPSPSPTGSPMCTPSGVTISFASGSTAYTDTDIHGTGKYDRYDRSRHCVS